MKKLLSLLLCVVTALSLALLGGCQVSRTEKKTILIAAPDGAPALAVYELMKNVDHLAGYQVDYKIVSGAANIGTTFASGEADIAVMPVNVAAKLYNNGTDLKLLSVNVFGVLYMVGKTPIATPNDLIGKVVVNIGQGGTPDITLKFILEENDVPYEISDTPVEGKVALKYVNDGSEVIALLSADKVDYGVLGEPAVSGAVKKTGGQIVMDLQSVWSDLLGEGTFTQAGIVVNKEVYSDNRLIAALNEKLTSNIDYLFEDAENISSVLQANGSALQMPFNEAVLTRCNLKHASSLSVKTQLEKYFNAILQRSPNFIGGKLPEDGFYM